MKLRHLLLGRKVMTNLDSILKNRDITLSTNVHLVKAMVFPVVMYACESWTIKKAECRRIDAFELWSWRRLLRVPWTTGKSNQSILKEINPEYLSEGLMLTLQYFGHLMQKANSLEKALMLAGKDWRQEKGVIEDEISGWPHQLNGHEWTNSMRWSRTGKPGMLHSMGSQRFSHDWASEQHETYRPKWNISPCLWYPSTKIPVS